MPLFLGYAVSNLSEGILAFSQVTYPCVSQRSLISHNKRTSCVQTTPDVTIFHDIPGNKPEFHDFPGLEKASFEMP